MAKKSKSKKSGGAGKVSSRDMYEEEEVDDSRLTLEALDAISTDSEDERHGNGGGSGIVEGSEGDSDDEWDAEAAALRRAIAEGAFDRIGMNVEREENKSKKQTKGHKSDASDEDDDRSEDDEGEEVALEDDSSDDDDDASDSSGAEDDIAAQRKTEMKRMQKASMANGKALRVVADELSAAHSAMSWSETFTVVPANPLPFGGAGGSALDVHDDLKREVAFYNTAMEGVIEARALCERSSIPFRRPDDFFAEMVKTDGKLVCSASINYSFAAV